MDTLLKHRLESLDVGFYAIAPLARFASSSLKILLAKSVPLTIAKKFCKIRGALDILI